MGPIKVKKDSSLQLNEFCSKLSEYWEYDLMEKR
jgi:hypothetical protein